MGLYNEIKENQETKNVRILGYTSMISEFKSGISEHFTGKFSIKDFESEIKYQIKQFTLKDHEIPYNILEIKQYLKDTNIEDSDENIQEFLSGQLDYRISELTLAYLKL